MKATKILPILLMLSTLSLSCSANSEIPTPVEVTFPLKQVVTIPSNEAIEKIAVSDTWIVIYTTGKLGAVDVSTQKPLWNMDFSFFTDVDSAFEIINNTFAAVSRDQLILIDKSGQKREINLDPKERNVTELVARYPNYLYVIGDSNSRIEAYDISRNTLLWKVTVGRVGTDVFYDELKNIAYVTTNDYSIRAIDNATGKILWTQDRRSLSAAYETGILYSVEDLGNKDIIRFSAFDVETQKDLWQQDVSPLKSVLKLTIIDDLLIASGSKGLIALDKSTGNLVWRTNVGETFYSSAVKFNDVLYAKGPSRKIYAISPTDGKVIGYVKLENANSIIENTNEIRAGVYKLEDGIVFNTRNAVYIYKLK